MQLVKNLYAKIKFKFNIFKNIEFEICRDYSLVVLKSKLPRTAENKAKTLHKKGLPLYLEKPGIFNKIAKKPGVFNKFYMPSSKISI